MPTSSHGRQTLRPCAQNGACAGRTPSALRRGGGLAPIYVSSGDTGNKQNIDDMLEHVALTRMRQTTGHETRQHEEGVSVNQTAVSKAEFAMSDVLRFASAIMLLLV